MVKNIIGVSIELSAKDVLFGISNTNEDNIIDILNLCILYAKWYIHKSKKDNVQLFLPDYIRMVKDKLSIEMQLCKLQNKEDNFKKWTPLYELL